MIANSAVERIKCALWYLVMVLLDGLAAAYLGVVAYQWKSPWEPASAIFTGAWETLHRTSHILMTGSEHLYTRDLVAIASMLGGVSAAPLLIDVLRKSKAARAGRGFRQSALTGIAYGYVTACVASSLMLPLILLQSGDLQRVASLFEASTLAALSLVYGIVFPILMLTRGPGLGVLILGGVAIGLINARLVRRACRADVGGT